jgi:hypothetical protein
MQQQQEEEEEEEHGLSYPLPWVNQHLHGYLHHLLE